MFEAASYHCLLCLVGLKANKPKCATFLLDMTSTYTRAVEDELCVFEVSPEGREQYPNRIALGGVSACDIGREKTGKELL